MIRLCPSRRRGPDESTPSVPGPRPTAVMRFGVLVAFIVVLAVAVMSGLMPNASTVSATLARAGVFAPVAIVVGTSLLLASLVPRTVLAAAAGVLFGALPGAAYVMAGAMLGAVLAFEVGRWLGRDFVRGRRRAAGLDRFLQRRGLLGVLTLRLLPVAPFGLVSYGFGATAVRRPVYVTGTVLGIAPSTLIFATLGANAMTPASPAFVLSTVAAVVVAAGGLIGGRRLTRRVSSRPQRHGSPAADRSRTTSAPAFSQASGPCDGGSAGMHFLGPIYRIVDPAIRRWVRCRLAGLVK